MTVSELVDAVVFVVVLVVVAPPVVLVGAVIGSWVEVVVLDGAGCAGLAGVAGVAGWAAVAGCVDCASAGDPASNRLATNAVLIIRSLRIVLSLVREVTNPDTQRSGNGFVVRFGQPRARLNWWFSVHFRG
jgi:hypothetical protein